MSLLDAVRWPAVIEELLDAVDDETRGNAMHHARNPDIEPMFRAGVGLAALVCPYPRALLGIDLARHNPGLDRDDADRIARWLVDTAPIVLRLATASVVDEPSGPVLAGILYVDPSLPDLPLLPLAADWATRAGGLSVIAAELPLGIGGLHSGRTIRLDPGRDPAVHFPHELGHVLDPHLGERGNPVLDEQYADLLGSLLMAHQPWTVEDAAQLVDLAGAAVMAGHAQAEQAAAGTRSDLPAAGPDAVIAFCLLPNRE